MATGLVLDETIRVIVRDEIKKAGLTNFNEEMDARADQKLNQLSKDVKSFPEDVDGTIASLRQDLETLRKQVLGM